MKTIKEFRNAGLEISEKDLIDGETGNKNSRAICIGYATQHGTFPVESAWQIREFAWRENTGGKPKFKGMVEWFSNVGTKHTLNTNTTWWNSKMIKWRPLLNQAIPTETPEEKEELDRIFGAASAKSSLDEVKESIMNLQKEIDIKPYTPKIDTGLPKKPKPVYTQEMYENKTPPLVGMKCDIHFLVSGETLESVTIDYISNKIGCLTCSNGGEVGFHITQVNFYPPKQNSELIDGECYQFTYGGEELKGCYGDKCFYHSIVVARVNECTNIRPLVLGDK